MNATLAQRVYAMLFDAGVLFVTIFGLPVLLAPLGLPDAVRGYLYAAIFLSALLAYDPWLVFLFGQTLGHRAMGIKVLRADGGRVSLGAAYVRFIVKSATGLYSFATMAGQRQLALQDIVTKTKVVSLRA